MTRLQCRKFVHIRSIGLGTIINNPPAGDSMGDFGTSALGEPDLGIENHLTPRAGGTPTIHETANLLELAEAHSCCEFRIC
jgi:hypothetical protein